MDRYINLLILLLPYMVSAFIFLFLLGVGIVSTYKYFKSKRMEMK